MELNDPPSPSLHSHVQEAALTTESDTTDWAKLLPNPGQRRLLTCQWNEKRFAFVKADSLESATHQLIWVAMEPLLTHLSERDYLSSQMHAHQCWEVLESMALLSVLRPGMHVVDAGANVGYYTRLFAKTVGPTGSVWAWEPEPANFRCLTANCSIPKAFGASAAPMHLFQSALDSHSGQAELSVYAKNLGYHSLVVREDWSQHTTQVTTMSLDQWREQLQAPSGQAQPLQVDLIKADVQGNELAILRGAQRLIEDDHPILCLEVEPSMSGTELCLELVSEVERLNYTQFRLFNAIEHQGPNMIRQSMEWLTAQQVQKRIRDGEIGRFGTLWAQ